jgi:hypothetical protein
MSTVGFRDHAKSAEARFQRHRKQEAKSGTENAAGSGIGIVPGGLLERFLAFG